MRNFAHGLNRMSTFKISVELPWQQKQKSPKLIQEKYLLKTKEVVS